MMKLCEQAAEKHDLNENQLEELIERVCIMLTENQWTEQRALTEALKCQGIYSENKQEEFMT